MYWTLQHRFKYNVANRTPLCHLCCEPAAWLDEHLIFHCHDVEHFRIDNPYIRSNYQNLSQLLQDDTNKAMPHLFTYYHYVRKLRTKPATEQPVVDNPAGTSSDSKPEDDYSDRSFRPSSSQQPPPHGRVLRSQTNRSQRQDGTVPE